MMNFRELYNMIKIIDIYQELKLPKNWTLSDTIFYRVFNRYMTIAWNKLFSIKIIFFNLWYHISQNVQALLTRYYVQQYQKPFTNQQKYHKEYFLYLSFF